MIEAEKLRNVIYSPEFVSRLLHRFISGAQTINKEGIKFELTYLLLPLIMNEKYRKSLENANKNSNFSKAILSKENHIENIFLNSYITETKQLLKQGTIYLSSYENLKIGKYISVKNAIGFKSEDSFTQEYYRASYYLGLLLSKEHYRSVFTKTKVSAI